MSCRNYMVRGWQSQETSSCFAGSKGKVFFSLTGTSDQNGFLHLISVLQVSKLSPREARVTCPKSYHQEILQ